ncbi:dTDP-4-dehydrorhamnose reductase [Pseudomonas fluorescens NCIMB 11764]|uniref:dTDP-4-dehydrorhamnose reductase n=1 Tax=Pseudomonas fluorescens NCIMB 11764 TaxID=1221522 RepID=A0A0K1QPC9_PSEFL|nr:SDR family oxidoreductase [Pseudomonas fluorescens]AKV07568.1 dTDP-4-dehydrorhamnose reductase [Pseudomonas fluorescens NCIMB 11764]
MKILVLGVTGMLGSEVFNYLSDSSTHEVFGTLRRASDMKYFDSDRHVRLISRIDVLDHDSLVNTFAQVQPDVVINCIGLIKQLAQAEDPLTALPINAMLPHRLANLCEVAGARLIHISTDCVFLGNKGLYQESDRSDCDDLYGKSKYIGEVHDRANTITLRTSIIGHALSSDASLVDWFLAQKGSVKGFTQAIFSGVPTAELARIILEFVLPDSTLHGLYHVSADPIDKFTLLSKVSKVYNKDVDIVPDAQLSIDRSLDSSRFRSATGYTPRPWDELLNFMRSRH